MAASIVSSLVLLGFLLLLLPTSNAWLIPSSPQYQQGRFLLHQQSTTRTAVFASADNTATTSASLSTVFQQSEAVKTCHVESSSDGGGLIATKSLRKGDVVVGVALDEDTMQLRGNNNDDLFKSLQLPEGYTSWTGETGLLALQVLDRVATAAANEKDSDNAAYWKAWVQTLPLPDEMNHPLLWSEEDQEMLQSSSTNKIYRQLDDIEEDVQWLTEHVFDKNRERFPATVTPSWRSSSDEALPCFSLAGYTWAMAIVQSRSFFLDGTLRLIPFLDACRHDSDAVEIQSTGLRTLWGSVKGAKLVADRDYKEGDEVKCSYGPKSAAEYLLEHGFVPEACWKVPVSELTFEVDQEDRFYDDKLDILEFETYNEEPMDPTQSFDVVLAGAEEQPDPAMIQFVRLCKLGATDAFLLESIFRKDAWGFMSMPVSEKNEVAVVETILSTCQKAMDEFSDCPTTSSNSEHADVCKRLRDSETAALQRLVEYLEREKEALDLKEYYQERRLKDLGLDSTWSPEDNLDGDLSYGQTRLPGGADYDW